MGSFCAETQGCLILSSHLPHPACLNHAQKLSSAALRLDYKLLVATYILRVANLQNVSALNTHNLKGKPYKSEVEKGIVQISNTHYLSKPSANLIFTATLRYSAGMAMLTNAGQQTVKLGGTSAECNSDEVDSTAVSSKQTEGILVALLLGNRGQASPDFNIAARSAPMHAGAQVPWNTSLRNSASKIGNLQLSHLLSHWITARECLRASLMSSSPPSPQKQHTLGGTRMQSIE